MRVLIIDDKPPVRQILLDTLEEDGPEWEAIDQDFDGLGRALARFRPDLLVLDLVQGQGASGQPTGNEAFDEIRRRWFCSVVVYSAFPDEQDFEHPLVKTVTKGEGSEFRVLERLKGFVPHAEMIRCVHRDFDARIREALRDSVEALRRRLEAVTGRSWFPAPSAGWWPPAWTRVSQARGNSRRGSGSSCRRSGITCLRQTC